MLSRLVFMTVGGLMGMTIALVIIFVVGNIITLSFYRGVVISALFVSLGLVAGQLAYYEQ